jgi:hypothetical protein
MQVPETRYAITRDGVVLIGELKGVPDRWHLYRVVDA